jgi:hypothetical protein
MHILNKKEKISIADIFGNNVKREFPYNPEHPIGTCAKCGKEMEFNVPRVGPDGGYVHKDSSRVDCHENN